MTTKVPSQLVNGVNRRNVIINGNFDIWQRGPGTWTGIGFTSDRWKHYITGSSVVISRQSFTLGQTDIPNEPTYYIRSVVTSLAGAGNFNALTQTIESVRTLAGKTATLSFYAKADASKNIAVDLEQHFGTGGSPSASVNGIGVTTCALTTSWQKFTVTVAIPSISGKTLGTNNDHYLVVVFWLEAGSDYNTRTNSLGQQSGTFDIAQVQLEAGTSATDFEYRSIGEELQLCQRYFEKSYNLEDPPGTASTNGIDGNLFATGADTNGRLSNKTRYQVKKRSASPSIIIFDALGNGGRISTHNQSGTPADNVTYTAIPFVGETGFQIYKESAGNICGFEYHWTADAEI